MKHTLLVSAVAMLLLFASCKKETTVTYTNNSQVAGFYAGKYGAGTPVNNLWTLLRTDGSCRFYTDGKDTTSADKADGLYNAHDGKLIAWFRYAVNPFTEYTAAATLTGNVYNGTWGPGQLTTGTVVIILTKQ